MLDFALILSSFLVVGIPLLAQAHFVLKEKHGYRKDPKYKDHPELKGVRKGDKMLFVSFDRKDREQGKSK